MQRNIDAADLGAVQMGLGGIILYVGTSDSSVFWIVIGAIWALLGFANMISEWTSR